MGHILNKHNKTALDFKIYVLTIWWRVISPKFLHTVGVWRVFFFFSFYARWQWILLAVSDRLYFTALIKSLNSQWSVVYHGYSVNKVYHFYCVSRPRCQLHRVLLRWPGTVWGQVNHGGGRVLRHLVSGPHSAIVLWDTHLPRLSDHVLLWWLHLIQDTTSTHSWFL